MAPKQQTGLVSAFMKEIKGKKKVEKKSDKPKTLKPKITKKYARLGQTKDTPCDSDPLRRFYESLLVQKPDSMMATKWCLEHGLIPDKDIDKAYVFVHMQKIRINKFSTVV